jgi:DNA repair exonuclease SbcCD ATPase subunit
LSEKRNRELGDERDKIKQEAYDLARQVRSLLKSHADDRAIAPSSSSSNGDSPNEVISAHLVSIHSIEEMQDQNMKLRQVSRDLAARNEELQRELDTTIREKERLGPETEEKLRDAHRLIDDGRAERSRLQSRFEAVVQRLNLKEAADRLSGDDGTNMVSSSTSDSKDEMTNDSHLSTSTNDSFALTKATSMIGTPSRTPVRSSSLVPQSPMLGGLVVPQSRAGKELG